MPFLVQRLLPRCPTHRLIGEALEHLYVVFDGMVPYGNTLEWGYSAARNGDKTMETWHDSYDMLQRYKVNTVNSGICEFMMAYCYNLWYDRLMIVDNNNTITLLMLLYKQVDYSRPQVRPEVKKSTCLAVSCWDIKE